jgi:hypothetical protein
MTLKFKKNGQVRFRAYGRRVRFMTPNESSLQITVGFRDPSQGDAANRCSAAVEAFRTTRKGALVYR